jgi:energy-coupling factor transporter ATP-binding protein EcfA2
LSYADVARKPIRDLSGGMRQKLLIGLAFAQPVALLVLDEPTASLDRGARQRFLALLGELPSATTVVMCSHRHEDLRASVDRVVVLREGRLDRVCDLAEVPAEVTAAGATDALTEVVS